MSYIRNLIAKARGLNNDERGLTTVEYVIVLMLIAVVGIVTWQAFGESVANKVTSAGGAVDALPESGAATE